MASANYWQSGVCQGVQLSASNPEHLANHARLPPRRTGLNTRPGHRIFASGNRAVRCLCLAGFLRDLPFPPPLNYGPAPYSLHSPSSALKISLLRAAQISSLTHTRTL
ncbi:hypothetical protein PR048_008193 [Dryococelus australis]|uniref:Uncharacterized protein n=1 Tax=Dryococelus australis TaxID=614101 RepID=A0ABQ9HWE9_9NEOP|nr:hypothetical protein PR048_008193 [Dryococelus australis]